MKILKYYDELYQAELDRQLLSGKGIPVELFNELVSSPAFSGNTGRPYLAVPDRLYEEAMEILSESNEP